MTRRRPRATPLLDEFSDGLDHLSRAGDLDHACLTLARGLALEPTTAVQQQWLAMFERFGAAARARHPGAAWLSVRLYSATRQQQTVLTFVEQARPHLSAADWSPLVAYQALALTASDQHRQALEALEPVLPTLSGLAAGIGWRARAQALCRSDQEGWQSAFVQARSTLSGRALGLCWTEEGTLLEWKGQDAEARDAWRQALLLLDNDRFYLAWLRHALGSSCLRFALPEAEDHFLALEQAVRHPEAAQFRPWAECGLGASRRARGEWPRALTCFRRAISSATESADLRQAWRGLGHTQRLMGKPDLALEALLRASRCTEQDIASGQSWVYADIAACHAQLGQWAAARLALLRVGADPLSREDRERAALVRAELARQDGDPAAASTLLAQVRPQTLWAREELRCFPELFGLLDADQCPLPLHYTVGTQVEVHALGPLLVRVNKRPVPLASSGRPGELLVFLLEHHNRAASEVILEALYPGADQGRRRRDGQALWAQVQGLRKALGWQGSVQTDGRGVYLLDPAVEWWYDVREATARGEATPEFLSGNYRPWAQQRAQQLLWS
ncbi:tetratricopeptide repeat protein [Deinococcus sp.]|uniref:tetratricopeptide repeat protein n=1 Tax=Deinococcus sp. TaxID=47478 RepID=UPI003CC602AE